MKSLPRISISKEELVRIKGRPPRVCSRGRGWPVSQKGKWLLIGVLIAALGSSVAGAVAAWLLLAPSSGWISELAEQARYSVLKLQSPSGGGTGFVIASRGSEHLVLTNFHVVRGSSRIRYRTYFGTPGPARLVASAPSVDLAMLVVRCDELRPLGPIASYREIQTGAEVLAIGHPLGAFDFSLSRGIISAKRGDLLQLDISINPGNSGGPVLGARGSIYGVSTMVFRGDRVDGIAFAVPADIVFKERYWRHFEKIDHLLERVSRR